jgi:hypothetical protein
MRTNGPKNFGTCELVNSGTPLPWNDFLSYYCPGWSFYPLEIMNAWKMVGKPNRYTLKK